MVLPPQLAARTRMVYDLREHGIESVPTLGRYSYTHANPALADHSHPNAVEVCLLVRGRQIYSVGTKQYSLRGGEIFMTYPNETHGTGGAPEEKGLLYWLTLLDPAQTNGSLAGLPRGDSQALWREITECSRRQFAATANLKRHLDVILQTLHSPETTLSKVTRTNHLIGYLLGLIAARKAALTPAVPRFETVLSHIAAHIAEPDGLSVGALAQVAGMSSSRFKTLFRREHGIPPAEYVLRARIAEARRLLSRRGASVTDVAFELGFSSSQYFASSFKRLTNITPRDFQRTLEHLPGP